MNIILVAIDLKEDIDPVLIKRTREYFVLMQEYIILTKEEDIILTKEDIILKDKNFDPIEKNIILKDYYPMKEDIDLIEKDKNPEEVGFEDIVLDFITFNKAILI